MNIRKSFGFICLVVSYLVNALPNPSKPGPKIRSISEWAYCDGVHDDRNALATAIQQARQNSFTLQIDCPLLINIGMDIAKPIFIDNQTKISGTPRGRIYVNNELVPAFVIANTHDVTLANLNFIYTGEIPLSNMAPGGYFNNGEFIKSSSKTPPAYAFNDITLKNWLITNRSINFDHSSSFWTGLPDPFAMFYIKGDSYNIVFSNLKIAAKAKVAPNHFIPEVVALVPDYKSNQDINNFNLYSAPMEVPHKLTFNNIYLDGYLMGWHGSGQYLSFNNIEANRYSVLQDEFGNNPGGINKWFSPPHLFYLNYSAKIESSLENSFITLSNVTDHGIKIGKVEDQESDAAIAGNAASLKLQAHQVKVNNYVSMRPDGFLDLMSSQDVVFNNVKAIYDSEYLGYLFPIIRFPCIGLPYTGYQDIKFINLNLADKAAITHMPPITGNTDKRNTNIIFKNVTVNLNQWNSYVLPFSPTDKANPTYFTGENNQFDVKLNYIQRYGDVHTQGISIERTNKPNNTLQNIPLGSFGLFSIQITNKNPFKSTFIFPNSSDFPLDMGYAASYTTCKLPEMELAPNQSCIITLKYEPQALGGSGEFKFQIKPKNNSKTIVPPLLIPYSTRKEIISHKKQ